MWTIPSVATALYDATLALAYPQACSVCGSSVENVADGCACAACWNSTRMFKGNETLCHKCGALGPGERPPAQLAYTQCGRCREEPFTIARATGIYEGALRAAVLRLKHEPHLPTRLRAALAFALQRKSFAQTTKIIPVPLSRERLRERGFNQASVLGKQLSRLTGLPLDEHSLVRTQQAIGHRAGMDALRRRESVAGAFSATRPRLLEKQRILLVDDVFTTGATVSSCTTELMEAGAMEVCVLTLARVR